MNLSGVYSLKSHGIFNKQGDFTPTSDYLKGQLRYGSENILSVIILFNESINSLKDILCYSGTYEVYSADEVVHHISMCSDTSRNNTSEIRKFVLEGNTLKLKVHESDGSCFEAAWIKS